MGQQIKPVDPFEGRPTTFDYVEDGVPTIVVHAQAVNPSRVKLCIWFAGIALLLLFIGVGQLEHSPALTTCLGGVGLLAIFVAMGFIMVTTASVKFTPTQIAVQRGWWDKTWLEFALAHNPVLTMMGHLNAQAEERAHQRAVRMDPAAEPMVVYGDSRHICLLYREQRYELLTVYGREEAERIFRRLNACLETSKARAGKGQTATKPQDQWGPTPGDIPAGGRR